MPERVYIVDDEAMVRRFIKRALDLEGMITKTFADGKLFLDAIETLDPGVVLLDIRMPEVSGLQVLETMGSRTKLFAVLILSSHGDVTTAVQAIRAGAIDFIEKPFSTATLIERVRQLGEMVRARQSKQSNAVAAEARLSILTTREQQIAQELSAGMANKEIARKMGISPRTVEVYRARMMRKLGISSVVDIVKLFTYRDDDIADAGSQSRRDGDAS